MQGATAASLHLDGQNEVEGVGAIATPNEAGVSSC
jgi:hypothetical protein